MFTKGLLQGSYEQIISLTNPKSDTQPEGPWWSAGFKNNECHCTVSSLLKSNPTRPTMSEIYPVISGIYDWNGEQTASI